MENCFESIGGYGSTLLNVLRCNTNIEFPLTLGRDFCGVVTRKGMNVREDIQIGDKVYGCVPPHRSGCHAEYVVVDESCVRSLYEFDFLIIVEIQQEIWQFFTDNT